MSGVLEANSFAEGSKTATVANIDQIQPQQPATITYSRRKGHKSYFISPQNSDDKNELADALFASDTGGELGSERSMKRLDVPEKDDELFIKEKAHKNGHAQKKDGNALFKKKDPFLVVERDDSAFPPPSKRERAEEAAAIVKKDKEEQQPKLDKDESIIAMALLKKDKNDVTATKKTLHASKKEKESTPSPLVVDDDGLTDEEFARITGSSKGKDDVNFKSSEPNTVRSILARAKEVLQTLDGTKSGKADSIVEKRENIALLKNSTESSIEENSDSGSATESTPVAPVTPVLSDPAPQKAQSTKSIIAAGKPKPGVKKSGSPPQVGAFGNTP